MSIGGNRAPGDLDPDEDVAHGNEDHGKDVAEDEVSDDKVEDFAKGVGPDVYAEANVGTFFEHDDQVEEEDPGSSDDDSEDPNEDDHHPSPSLGDLAF